jgi:hypothetical protein
VAGKVEGWRNLSDDQCTAIEWRIGAPWRAPVPVAARTVQDASETPEDRKRRLTRERVARHRAKVTHARSIPAVPALTVQASERWQASAPRERRLQDGRPVVSGVRSIRVSSRRWRERGTAAAVAAAIGNGRSWSQLVSGKRRSTQTKQPRVSVGIAASYAARLARYGAVGSDPAA